MRQIQIVEAHTTFLKVCDNKLANTYNKQIYKWIVRQISSLFYNILKFTFLSSNSYISNATSTTLFKGAIIINHKNNLQLFSLSLASNFLILSTQWHHLNFSSFYF